MKIVTALFIILFSISGFSQYKRRSIANIPVIKLIANIESSLKEEPRKNDFYFKLGRAYSIASMNEMSMFS